MDQTSEAVRTQDTLELIATYLEQRVLLKEYELGVRVTYEGGDPYVKRVEESEG
jgi:hypothetical protein